MAFPDLDVVVVVLELALEPVILSAGRSFGPCVPVEPEEPPVVLGSALDPVEALLLVLLLVSSTLCKDESDR